MFDLLKNKKRILFVYTSEADIYNEMYITKMDNYLYLTKLVKHISETYKYNDFTILCVHTNKSFTDTDNIYNYTINIDEKYISDDTSTNIPDITTLYRNTLSQLFKEIFKL